LVTIGGYDASDGYINKFLYGFGLFICTLARVGTQLDYKYKTKKKRRKNLATKDLKRISITLWQPYKASFIFVIQQVNLTISISNSNSNKAESGRSIFAVGDCQYQRYSSEKVKLL